MNTATASREALAAGLGQMQLCLQAADRRDPQWSQLAYLYLQTWLRDVATPGVPFNPEDFTDAAEGAGLAPHDSRAFGAIFSRAAREGLIRRSTTLFRRRKGHGSPTMGWERT